VEEAFMGKKKDKLGAVVKYLETNLPKSKARWRVVSGKEKLSGNYFWVFAFSSGWFSGVARASTASAACK